ncbi:8892_t:CDS:2 [Paraglomus brasilianum]|uniref:Mitochondrial transcription factor 1 n=1 Tax=Paraglomus brasilianum TaxID=144538 RepID=A0A9N9AN18_9GLOM|nr:8892_t:CDS:2 [Paraglomus brasilianum]
MGIPANSTVIEAYPGYGFLSKALLKNTEANKIVAIEGEQEFISGFLKDVENENKDKYQLLEASPRSLYTADYFLPKNYTGVEVFPWEQEHPSLVFVGQLPKDRSFHNAQWLNWMSCIVRRNFVYEFGRVRTFLFCRSDFAQVEHTLLSITPHADIKLKGPNWDAFAYIIRQLFLVKTVMLSKSIKSLGAGADVLLKGVSFNPDIRVVDMTAEQFIEIAEIFDEWPHRPSALLLTDVDSFE